MNKLLPLGQRESCEFHRFGLTQFAHRFPNQTDVSVLELAGLVARETELVDALKGLPRVEQTSDFHCVTTWSVRNLKWEGVRFADFYSQVIVPQVKPMAGATLVALRGQDGAKTAMLLKDLLASDVLLADRLNGQPLTVRHGAPLRLVAPAHYGYKSIKYLCKLEFMQPTTNYGVSGFPFMDHPRARVAFEERGRRVSGKLLRFLYRPFIRRTVIRFAKAAADYE